MLRILNVSRITINMDIHKHYFINTFFYKIFIVNYASLIYFSSNISCFSIKIFFKILFCYFFLNFISLFNSSFLLRIDLDYENVCKIVYYFYMSFVFDILLTKSLIVNLEICMSSSNEYLSNSINFKVITIFLKMANLTKYCQI